MAVDITSEFIKKLNKNKKAVVAAAKTVQSSGFLSDQEVCDMLGLEDGVKSVFNCRLTRIAIGIDKNKDPFVRPQFIISEGEHSGTTFSAYHGLGSSDKTKFDRELSNVFRLYQRLGIDTTQWPEAKIMELVAETAASLSEDRPGVKVALSRYIPNQGDDRLNITVIGLIEGVSAPKSSPPEDAEEVEDDEEVEVEEVEDETDEEESDESSDAETSDEDWNEWVGYACKFNTGDGEVECATVSYDEDTNLFTVEDGNGDQYEAYPDDLDFS